MSASFLEAASERRASLRSSTSELELSDSTDYEEDETAWRAGDDDGDEGEAEFGNGHVGGDAKATAAAIMAEAEARARAK